MTDQNRLVPASVPAWGYVVDGEVLNVADNRKPRKLSKGCYNCAYLAMGFKPVRVRVITEATYQRLRRAKK